MQNEHDERPKSSDVDKAEQGFDSEGGEDEGSAFDGSNDNEVHEDQKPLPVNNLQQADEIGEDDPKKAEKLTKAGRDIDPDAGSD